jgi:hypothetical protein
MGRVGRRDVAVPASRSGAVVPLSGVAEFADIQNCYNRYRAVSGGVAPDLVTSVDMVQARVALTRLLMADGWSPPDLVLERLRLDEELLAPRLLVAS